jgi:hypothetical protein
MSRTALRAARPFTYPEKEYVLHIPTQLISHIPFRHLPSMRHCPDWPQVREGML